MFSLASASFQGLVAIDIIKLYFKNLSKLIATHSNILKQQNKALQRKAFSLLLRYKYDKVFVEVIIFSFL